MRLLVGVLLAAVTLLLGPALLRADDPIIPWRELPETVEGYGETPEAAKNVALAKAQELVWLYLSANYPDIHWKPTPEYLQRTNTIVLLHDPTFTKQAEGASIYHVVYRLNKLSNRNLADLRDLSRIPAMYQRHRQAALVLGALVLTLLVLAGYLRLDEATHGYFSGRLLGALIGLVVLLGSAIFWWWI